MTQPKSDPSLQQMRFAVAFIFFMAGAVQANWIARIPAIQESLGINNGVLGVSLLGLPVGLIIAAPATGWLIGKWGSRAVTRLSSTIYCFTLALPPLAPSPVALFAALAVFGLCGGAMDVSMNTQASSLEKRYGKPIMSSFHGLFSSGGLAGSAIGGVAAGAGIAPLPHMAVAGFLSAVLVFVGSVYILREPQPRREEEIRKRRVIGLSRTLIMLGIVSFCVFLGEGAVADWSGVYMRTVANAGPGLAAAGFAAFSLSMAIGRLTGDYVNSRIGPMWMLRLGGALGVVGLAVALLLKTPVVSIIGFILIGAGFATIFPVAISAAGRYGGERSGSAISIVTTFGYAAFVVGPPVIGVVSEVATLPGALTIVAVLSAMIVLLSGAVRQPQTQEHL